MGQDHQPTTIVHRHRESSSGVAGQAHLSSFMIDHDVVGFHVSMHDALAMAEIQGLSFHRISRGEGRRESVPVSSLADGYLEQFIDIVANVVVGELGVEASKVSVVDVLEDQRGCLALRYAIGNGLARCVGRPM